MFKFKKIASILASTLMIGSTVGFAAATTVYPTPFTSDVAIVYGTGATLTDYAAAINIRDNLNTYAVGDSVTGTGTPIVSGGDYVILAKSSDKVNLRDSVTGVFGTTVTDDDAKVLLVDGKYSNDENTEYEYEQKITLGSGLGLEFFSHSDYKNRKPSVGVNITSNQFILNYTLDFTRNPESDFSGGDLIDFETTNINIMGKEYYVLDFDNVTSTSTVTLLDAASSGIVTEGESVTVVVGETSYDVSITYISTTEVKLNVNGVDTNTLNEGGTYKLSDGTYVGIKDILARDVAGSIASVEFSLGRGKLELRNGQSIRLNDKSISQVTSNIFAGSAISATRYSWDKLTLTWTTDESRFISNDSELLMPGLENIKFTATAFGSGKEEETTQITEGGADFTQIKTTLKDGDVTIPLLYGGSGQISGIGRDSSTKLMTSNAISSVMFNYTAGDRTFVASYNTSLDSESYYLKFSDFANDNGINRTTIQKMSGGEWKPICENKANGDTCTLGSLTLTINSISPHSDRAVNISGSTGSSFNTLYTKGGLKIALPYLANLNNSDTFPDGALNLTSTQAGHNATTFWTFMTEENKDGNVATGTKFNATIGSNSDNEIEVTAINTGRLSITDPDDTNLVHYIVYSDLATGVQLIGRSSDQRDAKITYRVGQAFSDIILTTKAAIVGAGGTGGGGGGGTTVGVPILDSEASSASTKNWIVVGGSCVNSIAAQLIGATYPTCGTDWTAKTSVEAGQYLIQTFEQGTAGKVATLVAGYNAGDTTNAATYLRTQTGIDTSIGKKYKGTTSTEATLVTEPITPPPVV